MADSPLTNPSASKTKKKPQNEQLPAWHDQPTREGDEGPAGRRRVVEGRRLGKLRISCRAQRVVEIVQRKGVDRNDAATLSGAVALGLATPLSRRPDSRAVGKEQIKMMCNAVWRCGTETGHLFVTPASRQSGSRD